MNISQVSERESAAKDGLTNLLNEFDVAHITGLSVASVRRWRVLRQGPRYLKIGSAVRYRPADISVWLESRPTGGGQAEVR
jgi:predicted DNA-binding transcriptional regulator AlpA